MSQRLSEYQLKELFRNRKFDSKLKAVSGKSIEILQTGTPNSDTGPDFRHSLIKINGVTLRGDIELHRMSSDWYAHNHHMDRNYNSVVLHVVTECDDSAGCTTEAGRRIETLELSRFLSSDALTFITGLEPEEKVSPLRCSADSHRVPVREKVEFLRHLGGKRFAHKVTRFEERLKDIVDENRPVVFEEKQTYFRDFADLRIEHRKYDETELQTESYWDQLLYEGIMEGLGYSKNTAPFRKLARNVSLDFLREHTEGDELKIDSILFGVAGLLPRDTKDFDEESREYIGKLDSAWQPVRKKYKREFVDKSEWLFFKLRPQNFPTIRIAGAGHLVRAWLAGHSCGELIRNSSEKGDKIFPEAWRNVLVVPAIDFWTRHYVFGALSTTEIHMLIGTGRAEEIIINTILPLTYLRGKIYHDPALSDQAMRVFEDHASVADNMVTLIVKESLFGGDNVLGTVAAQQGALHLYRSYCLERRCERCKIGKLLYGKAGI